MGISIFRDFVVVGGQKNPVKSTLLYHSYIGLPAVAMASTWPNVATPTLITSKQKRLASKGRFNGLLSHPHASLRFQWY
jgi:hypothetical protein